MTKANHQAINDIGFLNGGAQVVNNVPWATIGLVSRASARQSRQVFHVLALDVHLGALLGSLQAFRG